MTRRRVGCPFAVAAGVLVRRPPPAFLRPASVSGVMLVVPVATWSYSIIYGRSVTAVGNRSRPSATPIEYACHGGRTYPDPTFAHLPVASHAPHVPSWGGA